MQRSFLISRALILLWLVLLTACSPAAPTPTPTPAAPAIQTPTEASSTAPYPYPAPTARPAAYPAPTINPASLPTNVPAEQLIGADFGAITGQLLDTEGQPIAGLSVFLATVTEGPTPDAPVVSFSLQSSPRATADAEGRFVLGNVAPGTYSLAVWTPASASLIPAPSGEQDSAIQVDVSSNQVTDVGVIRIERP
jgi:hypothetical protein